LVSGSEVALAAGSSVDINNFPTKQSVFVENTAEGFDINVNVTNSTLDIHAYGVHNGNWVGLITDNNGHLIVHSELQDGEGTDLTSTDLGEGVQALDVAVKNAVSVSNTQETALVTKYLDASAVQVADNEATVYGPLQIGSSVDTNGFLWVAAQMLFGSVITGGNVYLEYSTDGTNWGRRFDSAFISTGSNVSAVIIPSAPSPFRYARLYADTPLQSTNVYAWITMK
jgi:hypothetical protein